MVFATLAVAATCSFAQTYSFDSAGVAFFTNPFVIDEHIWAEGIGPVDDTLTFTGLTPGIYNVTLDFEAARFNLVSLQVNGVEANVSHLSHVTYSFANLQTDLTAPFTVNIFGWFSGEPSTVGNYVGTLAAVAAVPEPETYALLLAGLGAVGFMAKRRKLNQA